MGGMRHQWPVSHKLIPGRLVSLVSPDEAGSGRQQPSSLPGALASAARIPRSRLRLRPSACGLAEAPRSRTEQRSRPALILSQSVPGACACWEHTRAGRSGGARVSDSGRELRVLLVFLSPPPAVMSRPGANCWRSVALGTPGSFPRAEAKGIVVSFFFHTLQQRQLLLLPIVRLISALISIPSLSPPCMLMATSAVLDCGKCSWCSLTPLPHHVPTKSRIYPLSSNLSRCLDGSRRVHVREERPETGRGWCGSSLIWGN